MKVRQLIEMLREFNPEMEVVRHCDGEYVPRWESFDLAFGLTTVHVKPSDSPLMAGSYREAKDNDPDGIEAVEL